MARVEGANPLKFLHAMLSQDVESLAPGSGALACLLDDKGRIEAELRVLALGDGTVLLDGPPASNVERLVRTAPLSGCEVRDESEAWTLTSTTAIDVPGPEHAHVDVDEGIAVRVEWGGVRTDVLHRAPAAVAPLDPGAAERARIEDGRVMLGIDVEPGTLVNETPLLARAVSFTKGCYPGQESVARVRNLGRARRRFCLLEGEVAPGPVRVNDEEIGRVTSASGDLALAVVEAGTEEGAAVATAAGNARVRALL